MEAERRKFLLDTFRLGGKIACAAVGFSMLDIRWAESKVIRKAGGLVSTASGYSPHLLFLWNNPTSTTVDYSVGDSVGTANGTVEISGGAVVTTDTGTNGEDYYSFDVSSNDIIDAGGTGTIFIRYMVTTGSTNYNSVIAAYQDYDDYLFLKAHTASEAAKVVYYSGDAVELTHGSALSLSTVYWARITFDDGSPYVKLAMFADSGGSMGAEIGTEVTNTTNDWTVGTPYASDALKIGNYSADNVVASIYRVAIYDDVRAIEP